MKKGKKEVESSFTKAKIHTFLFRKRTITSCYQWVDRGLTNPFGQMVDMMWSP